MTDKLSATMDVAKRVYSLAQEQNDAALTIGAYRALAGTHYFLGDFQSSRQNAMHGLQIWRSGDIQSHAGDLLTPAVGCLYFGGLSEWHLGEVNLCHTSMANAISLAKELNDMNVLAVALNFAAYLAHYERDLLKWNA